MHVYVHMYTHVCVFSDGSKDSRPCPPTRVVVPLRRTYHWTVKGPILVKDWRCVESRKESPSLMKDFTGYMVKYKRNYCRPSEINTIGTANNSLKKQNSCTTHT